MARRPSRIQEGARAPERDPARGVAAQLLQLIHNVPQQTERIPLLVKALTFAELRRPVGRESTMGVGVEPIVRDAQGVAAIEQMLQENLALVKQYFEELHAIATRNGCLRKSQTEGLTFTEVLTPEVQDQRAALRPAAPQRFMANSSDGTKLEDADWNPLAPETWRRR